jgi:succinate dehydrogenase/fumarate reductase cytochrome b subunit
MMNEQQHTLQYLITFYSFMVYLMILSVAHPLNGMQLALMNWKKCGHKL